ncbi:MAG TPA: hypothetical protein VFS00_31400, partial [Polyangiaceae bacterium]|nr:hypothetical protein [Polyangiaceae bacterium]
MAKLSVYQKAERALRLLLGLRNAHIAAAMRAHGFGDRDLAEGWALLRRLSVETLEGEAAPAPVGPSGGAGAPLRGLDAWENKWFAIASATLGRRVPEAKAWLFSNLSQASGLKVFFSVQVFVDRLERLGAPEAEGGLGRLGADVRALLAERGLNDAAIGEAKALLAELRRPEGGDPPPRGG